MRAVAPIFSEALRDFFRPGVRFCVQPGWSFLWRFGVYVYALSGRLRNPVAGGLADGLIGFCIFRREGTFYFVDCARKAAAMVFGIAELLSLIRL